MSSVRRLFRPVAPFVDADVSPGAIGERGASLVEYALLIALIALVAVGALQLMGVNLLTRFQEFAAMFGS